MTGMYVSYVHTYMKYQKKRIFYFILFYGFLREQQKIDSLVVIAFFFFLVFHTLKLFVCE